MAVASLDFEQGSGSYDASAALFRFNAYDAQGHVPCAISHEAFTILSGITHLDPDAANVIFVDWEDDIFAIARAKYDAGERADGGAVIVRAGDVPVG